MKCHILFSGKNKKNISKCCLLKILPRALFFSQNTCKLAIVLTRTVYILTTNELVKLTML